MSARSFRSVAWVAGVAATALGCYMVNLKVAAERAALEDVETRIVIAERDIRLLQTEIGTRGRLAQLEKWNVRVLALSAPAANQFVEGGFQLATLVAPQKVVDPEAPVVLASVPAPAAADSPKIDSDGAVAVPTAARADALLHVASFKREIPQRGAAPAPAPAPAPTPQAKQKSVEKPVATARSGSEKAEKPARPAMESPSRSIASRGSAAKAADPKKGPVKSASLKTAPVPADAKPKPVRTAAAVPAQPKTAARGPARAGAGTREAKAQQ